MAFMYERPFSIMGDPHGTDRIGLQRVLMTPISKHFVDAPIPSLVLATKPSGATKKEDTNPVTPLRVPVAAPTTPPDFIPL